MSGVEEMLPATCAVCALGFAPAADGTSADVQASTAAVARPIRRAEGDASMNAPCWGGPGSDVLSLPGTLSAGGWRHLGRPLAPHAKLGPSPRQGASTKVRAMAIRLLRQALATPDLRRLQMAWAAAAL